MISFSILSSGSKANCAFISNGQTNILLDCGLGIKRTKERLHNLGLGLDNIDAVVVSHEHHDHLAGLLTFLKYRKVPVFVAKETYRASALLKDIDKKLITFFEPEEAFSINNLQLNPFRILHDAADPVAFRISSNGVSIGVVTDLGVVTDTVRANVQDLHALVLESNHCPDLLESCFYPEMLKARIRGDRGHLSNQAAGLLVEELSSKNNLLQVLIAAHISENSNKPELARNSFCNSWKSSTSQPTILAASVYSATEMYHLGAPTDTALSAVTARGSQLSLL